MSGESIVYCPRCGEEVGRDHADVIQTIDVDQARVMLQYVENKEIILDQWKAMGFIQEV